MDKNRVKNVLEILKEVYPDAKIVLKYGNNWELLVAVILSAQCTDVKVNEVTSRLFPKYRVLVSTGLPRPAASDGAGLAMTNSLERQEIEKFATVPIEELEKDIRATGFYRSKAKSIQGAAKMVLEKFGGRLPRTMAEMLTLSGVARKTANVVLGNAYGVVEGIAVDTHVLRLSQRLRLVDPEKVGSGRKPVWFMKGRRTPAVRSPLPWSTSTRRGVATAGFGRASDFSRREKSGSSEKNLDYYKDASPEKIEGELMKIVPKEDWFKLTYLLIDHGRAICKAQNPDCRNCKLNKLCLVSRQS